VKTRLDDDGFRSEDASRRSFVKLLVRSSLANADAKLWSANNVSGVRFDQSLYFYKL